MTKFPPSTFILTNHNIADQLKFKAVMSLVERSIDGRNSVVPLYNGATWLDGLGFRLSLHMLIKTVKSSLNKQSRFSKHVVSSEQLK